MVKLVESKFQGNNDRMGMRSSLSMIAFFRFLERHLAMISFSRLILAISKVVKSNKYTEDTIQMKC